VELLRCGVGGHLLESMVDIARAYCSFAFCMYIWWGRVGDRIRSGLLCLRAAMAMMYDAITHSVTWMVAFSSPLVWSWFRP
jgi:predicted Co/Zn/Cd cation transporter (cation efflux family)